MLEQFQAAVDAAKKVMSSRTWKFVKQKKLSKARQDAILL